MERRRGQPPPQRVSRRRTIVLSANTCWNVVNFRAPLIREFVNNGFRVVVVAPRDRHSSKIADLGAEFVDLPMNSAGLSPLEDAKVVIGYHRIFKVLKPFAYLGFTIKPNIYGSIAARAHGVKVINNVSGLGTVFIKRSPLTLLVSQLYRISLRGSSTVFFQNREDRNLFVDKRLVRQDQAGLLPGSGIDLAKFAPGRARRTPGPFRFLFVGRLLTDKGAVEYIEAARQVRRTHPDVSFQILGAVGVNNRTAVAVGDLERWIAEGTIDYLGETDDVRPALQQADCVVLPSYREGLPRALLEGSAMGKPLIATDVPGCRDVVKDGENGFLCTARSANSLADAMVKMLGVPEGARRSMGECGRKLVERGYSETIVISKYVEALGIA